MIPCTVNVTVSWYISVVSCRVCVRVFFIVFLVGAAVAQQQVYDMRRATYIEIEHVRRLLDDVYGTPHSKAIDQALAWLFRVSR